ncbi:MAG: glyceraldehyde 3-phosphate dehydrogenase NAD-binding domain-containing protein [Candidatus Heimdallarchaeota archaeon]
MKVGINGTGLTAREIIKLVASNDEFADLQIAQINGRSMTIETLRDRLLYSTAQGHSKLNVEINKEKSEIVVNNQTIKYTQMTTPEKIEWLPEVNLLIESTGKFRDISKEDSDPRRHFKSPNNNLRGIVVSAPGKGGLEDLMIAASPNIIEDLAKIMSSEPFVFGGASCTTTATVPIVDTLDEHFGIESCYLSTIHAVTRSQELLDGSKGWSAFDTLLHTTGATKATNKVLKKKIPLDGIAYRTSDKAGSFIQIDAVLKKQVTKKEILVAFKKSKYAKFISYPKVSCPPSSYIRGDTNMVMIIPEQITIVNGNRVIIRGLYDNEVGYAAHFLRLIKLVLSKMK